MTDPGIDSASYPPSVLASAPVGSSRMRARPVSGGPAAATPAAGGQPASLRLAAGPGGYTTAVKAADRPRNLTELAERVDLSDRAPWPVGASLPMGERGKRAHWTGTEWRGGESPGYATPRPPVEPAVAMTELPPAGATQFPDSDTGEELHR